MKRRPSHFIDILSSSADSGGRFCFDYEKAVCFKITPTSTWIAPETGILIKNFDNAWVNNESLINGEIYNVHSLGVWTSNTKSNFGITSNTQLDHFYINKGDKLNHNTTCWYVFIPLVNK